jgi:hypothetical protein
MGWEFQVAYTAQLGPATKKSNNKIIYFYKNKNNTIWARGVAQWYTSCLAWKQMKA